MIAQGLLELWRYQSVDWRMRISWRSDLITCWCELQSRRAFRGGSFVDDALRLLERLTCCIGLIGQVKAGKSLSSVHAGYASDRRQSFYNGGHASPLHVLPSQ